MSVGVWNNWFYTTTVGICEYGGPLVVIVIAVIAVAVVGIVGIVHHCSDNAPSLSTVFLVMYFKQMSTQKSEFSAPVLIKPLLFFVRVRQHLRRPFRFKIGSFDSLPLRTLFIGPEERQRV